MNFIQKQEERKREIGRTEIEVKEKREQFKQIKKRLSYTRRRLPLYAAFVAYGSDTRTCAPGHCVLCGRAAYVATAKLLQYERTGTTPEVLSAS
jgi:hypothetical protein